MIVLDLLLALAALPLLGATLYLAFLALAWRRAAAPPGGSPHLHFDVVVPAHDEAAGIAGTVENLRALDYPKELFRVHVIADNCSDDTAERARAAGASVMMRQDPVRRGKGYALEYAYDRLLKEGFCDAIVVVDADSRASKNLLTAFAARLERGAGAIQAYYGVRNPEASWRTRLMDVAFVLFHEIRSGARERLGLSAGLRGNGMCFSRAVLTEVPHAAYSVVEDLEYGIALGRAGFRIHYAGEAQVLGDMVPDGQASTSQRHRWEGGRSLIARTHARRLLKEAVVLRDRIRLDLALDLLIPPIGTLAVWIALGGVAASALTLLAGTAVALAVLTLSVGLLGIYVARGWQVSGAGWEGFRALLHAPAYVAWKLARLPGRARATSSWVRTARNTGVAGEG